MKSGKTCSAVLIAFLLLVSGCAKEKFELVEGSEEEISLRSEMPATVLWDYGQALEINNHNQVVGYQYEWVIDDYAFYPIFWDKGVIQKPWDYGLAFSINDRSQILGYQGTEDSPTAILWEKGDVTELWSNGVAYRANRQGQIVGYQGNNAVMWENGVLTILWEDGVARYINDRGQVVGFRGHTEPYEAMFWEKGVAIPISANGVAVFIDNRAYVCGMEANNAVSWVNEEPIVLWNEGAASRTNLAGEAVGYLYINEKMDAVYSEKGDLIVLKENATAYSINGRSQVVGTDLIRPLKALMWEVK